MLLIGTLPGVVIGAFIRVFLIPGPQVFRLLVAGVPSSSWDLAVLSPQSGDRRPAPPTGSPRRSTTIALAAGVGVIGGIYGIGGGSLLSPILVGRGMPIATVAPATLVSTFVTSAVGAITYLMLAIATPDTRSVQCGPSDSPPARAD